MKKVLILGNIPTDNPSTFGGATILTSRLLKFLEQKEKLSITFLPIRKRWKSKWQIIDYVIILFKFPFIISRYDIISIHASKDVHFTIGPFLVLWCKVFKKKVVYHFFGGSFHKVFDKYNFMLRFFYKRTIFRSNIVLFETKELVNYFSGKTNAKLVWFPNARKKQNTIAIKKFEKKFVFISKISKLKGIDLLIKIQNSLSDEYKLDIYGPLDKDYALDILSQKKMNYLGFIEPNLVAKTINKYDVLILPTLHLSEGYPGIIIEALSCGKPIIATKMKSIEEIIDDYEDGILFERNNESQLLKAINHFDEINYDDFCNKALKKFENYDEKNVFNKLFECYLNL